MRPPGRRRRGPGLSSLLAALTFLTVFPANVIPGAKQWAPSQQELSGSRAFFPAVGLLIGLMLVGLEWGCSEVFPVYLSAAVLLVSLIVVNRGLHLDGLMDSCDGLFGGFTQERSLEIMRDSQVGAFGVAGGAGVLLLKYGALVSLLGFAGHDPKWSLLLFPMLSRWAMVVTLSSFPYVRQQGLGSPFHQGGKNWSTATAAVSAGAAAVLLGGIAGAGMLAGATVIAWLLGWATVSKLGGMTGDTYGAVNEVVGALALAAAVALLPHGWLETLPQF